MRGTQDSPIAGTTSLAESLNENPAGRRRPLARRGEANFVVSLSPSSEFTIAAFDDAFGELLGRRGHIAPGRPVRDALERSVAGVLIDQLHCCAEMQETMRFEIPIRRDRQSSSWNFVLVPLKGDEHGSSCIVGRASEDRSNVTPHSPVGHDQHMLERLAATSHDILYVVDIVSKKLVYVNGRVKGTLGYDASALLAPNSPIGALVHPADRPILEEHYSQLAFLSSKDIRSVEYRVRRADGRYVWLRSSDAVFSRASNGAVQSIVGSAIDVTDNRHLLEDLKRISSRLLETQNEERRRIGRELHDSTAQHLVALSVGIARLDYLIRRDCRAIHSSDEMGQVLNELRTVSRQAQQEIRTLSYLLHPPVLESMGLADALRKFLAGFARRTGIRARFTVSEAFSCGSHGVSTALMRIAQEALINVFRHAKASEVRVSLANRNHQTVLEVIDNGKGMRPSTPNVGDESAAFGVGIPGMRARVQQFRGDLRIHSDENGTTIRATVPERAAPLIESSDDQPAA
jgi:PAS domain S-box-containing protein